METIFGFPKAHREDNFQFKRNALNSVIFTFGYNQIEDILDLKNSVLDLLKSRFAKYRRRKRSRCDDGAL